MVKVFLYILFMLNFTMSFGQNLIPNPSFEELHQCPKNDESFDLKEWTLPTDALSNNFYPCGIMDTTFSTPKNYFGTRSPRTGKGYAGIYLFSNSGYNSLPYREYLQVKLTKKLIAGKKYKFSCFLCLGHSKYGTDHFQVYFSTKEIYQPIQRILQFNPQITNPGIFIIDKKNWTEFKGEFIAKGDETYIVLGNFDTDANTSFFQENDKLGVSSYYYIDDVSLYECDKLVELGPDTIVCKGSPYTLNAYTEGATYLWQDNSNSSSLVVTEPGLYWVDVNKDGCYTRDSIYVNLKDPSFSIGNDTTLCKGETYRLKVADIEGPYIWSNRSVENNIQIKEAGEYWLTANINGCDRTDTIEVSFENPFIVYLGKDTTLCYGEALELEASRPSSTFIWNDNSTEAKLSIQESGTYSVTVRGIACESKDSISVKFYDCPKDIPNVITPNNDEKNETFTVKEIREDTWHIEIVNRWGHTVYEDENYKNSWNGNGLASGVYYYNLKNLSSNKSYKGWVEILK